MSEDLGIEVRSKLWKAKMSQAQLAEKLEISEAYLSDIIRGKKDGNKAQEHVKRIKNILGI